MTAEPALEIAFLSRFVESARWMKKHKSPWRRLLYRLAVAHLELLTELAARGEKREKKWTEKVG